MRTERRGHWVRRSFSAAKRHDNTRIWSFGQRKEQKEMVQRHCSTAAGLRLFFCFARVAASLFRNFCV
jgi:hypothetical protein